MSHSCHWPGCKVEVPPAMWGCKPHWFKLPRALRDKIWAAYRPGQEVTKTPSAAYLEAAQEVRHWCIQADMKDAMPKMLEKRGDRWWATDESARKLEAWFAERDLTIKVAVNDGRFEFPGLMHSPLSREDSGK